jgi:hypothetical protein
MEMATSAAGGGPSPERLERFLVRTWWIRRVFFYGVFVLPWFVTMILGFLALYPMLFQPTGQLTSTLAALLGAGLSFSSVAFSAANARASEEVWSLRMAMAGSALLQFSIAMAVALALSVARERVVAALGSDSLLDYAMRGMMGMVTATAIALAFVGLRIIVMIFRPSIDEPALERLRGIRAARG